MLRAELLSKWLKTALLATWWPQGSGWGAPRRVLPGFRSPCRINPPLLPETHCTPHPPLLLHSLAPAATASSIFLSASSPRAFAQAVPSAGSHHCRHTQLTSVLHLISLPLALSHTWAAPREPNNLGEGTIDSVPLVNWVCGESCYVPPFHR